MVSCLLICCDDLVKDTAIDVGEGVPGFRSSNDERKAYSFQVRLVCLLKGSSANGCWPHDPDSPCSKVTNMAGVEDGLFH